MAGSWSTAVRITAAWSSATAPAAIAVRVVSCWSSTPASRSRPLAARRVWRVVLAHQVPVSAAPTSVPRSRVLAAWAAASSRAWIRLARRVIWGSAAARSVSVMDQNRGSPRSSRSVWARATTAATGWVSRSSNAVAIQGILAPSTDKFDLRMRSFRALWRTFFGIFCAMCGGFETVAAQPPQPPSGVGGGLETALGRLLNHRQFVHPKLTPTRDEPDALAARPPEGAGGFETALARLLNHRKVRRFRDGAGAPPQPPDGAEVSRRRWRASSTTAGSSTRTARSRSTTAVLNQAGGWPSRARGARRHPVFV